MSGNEWALCATASISSLCFVVMLRPCAIVQSSRAWMRTRLSYHWFRLVPEVGKIGKSERDGVRVME